MASRIYGISQGLEQAVVRQHGSLRRSGRRTCVSAEKSSVRHKSLLKAYERCSLRSFEDWFVDAGPLIPAPTGARKISDRRRMQSELDVRPGWNRCSNRYGYLP
ncbi:hypothetical protein IG631_22214 [Alternaria alternata]|nr:hypothetical protein IG631_22214 [Alternaria alternata]